MKRLLPITTLLAMTGCASIFSGTTQDITLRTTPGATYSITDSNGKQVARGTGHGTASLERGAGYFSPHAYKARISKPGHMTKTVDIQPGMNPWYFANILIGGFVGMVIVDPLTGAMYKFYPSDIEATLEPANPESATVSPIAPSIQPHKSSATIVSRYEYTATERAKAQGCRPTEAPSTDSAKDPHETLTFTCQDGRRITVACSVGGCT
jgi:hypothetical protein